MTARVAVLSDVHGNLAALEAVRKAIKKEKPDAVIVAGDHVMNGPDPVGTVDAIRDMEASGATIVQGNTDVAVADFDYAAAFPWLTDGIPDTFLAAAEWAHDELGDDRLGWLRRQPSERPLFSSRNKSPVVMRSMPSLSIGTLKLIKSPSGFCDSFRYVNSCAW